MRAMTMPVFATDRPYTWYDCSAAPRTRTRKPPVISPRVVLAASSGKSTLALDE